MSMKIAPGLSLPPDAATQTFAIMAIRGVGKTHTATVFAEELLKIGQPVCIYDPTGAWWGLKSSADGKRPGFPVVIFGGEHADVPLEETAGEVIARTIVERRVPAILDCSLLRKAARVRFMTAFCETLYHLNREPLHLFCDEAHTIAPQNIRAMPEAARCLGAIEDIILQGRRRGLGMTAISQRPAMLNTTVRTQCSVLIAMRIVGPHDRKAISEWVESHGDSVRAKEMMDSLAHLKVGEGWVWSPGWLEIFQRVKFRQRETYDSSATPKVGGKVRGPQAFAEIDLQALGDAIQATVEKAKADDPKELRKKIRELEASAKQAPAGAAQDAVDAAVGMAVARAIKDRDRHWQGELAKLSKHAEGLAARLRKIEQLANVEGDAPVTAPPAASVQEKPMREPSRPVIRSPRFQGERVADSGEAKVGKAERNVLRALYWMQDDRTIDQRKIAFLAGYSPAASTISVALSNLRKAGLIEGFSLTAAGREALPENVEAKPTGPELREWLRGKIGAAENKVLDVLVENPGQAFTNVELAEATGYSPEASTISVALSHLRKFEAVESAGRGLVKAADVFFE